MIGKRETEIGRGERAKAKGRTKMRSKGVMSSRGLWGEEGEGEGECQQNSYCVKVAEVIKSKGARQAECAGSKKGDERKNDGMIRKSSKQKASLRREGAEETIDVR